MLDELHFELPALAASKDHAMATAASKAHILIRIITKNNLCFKIRTADDFMRHYDYFKSAMDEGQSNIDVDMTTEKNVIIKDRNPKNKEDE